MFYRTKLVVMQVENLRDPIEKTNATKTIGLSVGGRIKVIEGAHPRYDGVTWKKDAMSLLGDGPNGKLLLEVDWVGIESSSGHTITRVQTYEVNEDYELLGLMSDRVSEEAQFGSGVTGGKYYDGS